MKIAIIGAGGVGGYFGAKMAYAGYDVTFIARGRNLKAMQENGLKVKSILGDFELSQVKATDNISELVKPDLVIAAVKAWQVKGIASQLKAVVGENTTILPLENGIMASEEISELLGENNVIAGLCRIISKIESPGVINHFGVKPTIVFGELDNSITPRINQIKEAFDKSGIYSVVAHDIQAELWKKFISICTSGLMAITRSPYGVLREMEGTRRLMRDVLTEIYNLAVKAGINLESCIVEKAVGFIDTMPYESTASLARDVWAGKPSEIEYQNGTVVRLGEKYQVETPVNSFIYNCILPMEVAARRKAGQRPDV